MQYWEEDERTSVVGLYLESMGNPRKFSRIARRLATSKPVVVMRPGRPRSASRPGMRCARAARPPRRSTRCCARAGASGSAPCTSSWTSPPCSRPSRCPRGPRVGVVANSEGLGALVADACLGSGLVVPRRPVQRADHGGAGASSSARWRRRWPTTASTPSSPRSCPRWAPAGRTSPGRSRTPPAAPTGRCSPACSAWAARTRTASRPTPPLRRRCGRWPRSTWYAGWRGRRSPPGWTRRGAIPAAARRLVEGLLERGRPRSGGRRRARPRRGRRAARLLRPSALARDARRRPRGGRGRRRAARVPGRAQDSGPAPAAPGRPRRGAPRHRRPRRAGRGRGGDDRPAHSARRRPARRAGDGAGGGGMCREVRRGRAVRPGRLLRPGRGRDGPARRLGPPDRPADHRRRERGRSLGAGGAQTDGSSRCAPGGCRRGRGRRRPGVVPRRRPAGGGRARAEPRRRLRAGRPRPRCRGAAGARRGPCGRRPVAS